MSIPITAGSAAAFRRIPGRAVLKSNGISPAVGEVGDPFIMTNSGAPTTSGVGSLVEIDDTNAKGEYYVELDATEVEAADIDNLITTTFETGTAVFVFETAKIVQGLTGAFEITATIKDQFDVNFPGATIDVFDSGNTLFLGRVQDGNEDGVLVFLRNAGTYALRITGPGFQADTIPEILVVSADGSVEFTGVRFVTPSSSDPALCRITGFLFDTVGDPWNDRCISFYTVGDGIVDLAVLGNRLELIITGPRGNVAWADGEFQIELPRLSSVLAVSKDIGPTATGLSVIAVIPDEASATFDSVFRS